jgi:ribonuclease Y
MKREEAREILVQRVEEEFREIGAKRARQIENEAVQGAERRAKKVVLDTIQRCVVDYVTEATLAVIELPSEDMKGRIIGREGRNIRAFEQVTGVDLIVDETPEAVVISSFDPVRREVARLTLMNLMVDGRIHPSRIEELHEKAALEVDRTIREAGERAAERANVHGLPPKVIETMGRLRFRTSYAQNVLDHSVEVSRLAVMLASELGLNAEVAKRAGFLHDIGKALGPEWEGPHAITGMEFLRGIGEKEPVLLAVGAHHFEIEPTSPEAMLVIISDSISAARPGARRENLENYLKRLTALEGLANSFPGVERSYAVQAGREIRLIVKPHEIDDLAAVRMASDVAKRIENELEYPGQIKVTVIRETRVQQVAK